MTRRDRRNRRKWQVFGIVLALSAIYVLAVAVRGTEWVSIFGRLWQLVLCVLGGMSLLVGVLLKRGALQQGPWLRQYAGAQMCLGSATLLAFAPGLLVTPGKSAPFLYGALQWASLLSLALYILFIALWCRARRLTRPSGDGVARV